MANLIRLCNIHSTETVNSLFSFKKFFIKVKSVKVPSFKLKPSTKWHYHFTKRKLHSTADKPVSIYIKLGIGLFSSLGLKLVRDNTVFCLEKHRSRLVSTKNIVKESDFNWTKFFKYLQIYWLELLGAILAAIICAALNIQIPRALGVLKPVIKIIAYFSLQSLFTFFYIALLSNIGEGMARTMKTAMFSSIMKQDMKFFDLNRSGEILNILIVDIQDFKSSFKMVISQGLKNLTQIIGCAISLFLISPAMTGISLFIVPTGIICGNIVGSKLRKLSYHAKSQCAKVTLTAEEAISNVRTVRSFAMEDVEYNIFNEEAKKCEKLNTELGYGIALLQAGSNFFLNAMVLGTIYIGGYMMSIGNITAGNLMAFLVSVQLLQRSFTQMSVLYGFYIKGKHAGARVFEMIDLPPGITLGSGKKIPYHSLLPNVEFKNVVFSYPSRLNQDVLSNINLYIPEGKTVAIVGSSGSGKSTLAWLLERFYDVEEGVILIGGEDIKTLDPTWLRKNVVGFISQEPVLFATSVLENIRYGKQSASDEEEKAAKMAHADEFIRKFPDGYNTVVGERGVSVSGGQKQRIAIARALLKNPSILILDEATSALDSESEKALQMSLDAVTKHRTTIVIAHRLSTIKNADLIIVLNNGVIVESGTHGELLSKNGMYATLVAQQM
ncbi:ATP-binding cassette subfamily B, member 8 [Pediculus humanus corporis]|uniref:Mitochondrial potassium channel ATP-binding subunit n=1 Tax=Pediculus humanus subsp. corporis TaxID=121224 RepID=E0VH33_PEDHC|nr:ATP-binding cassette subfamily B, member 8 [Pediculus humanus corporis]EEB12689.1 ATP-binding cassette subfamily B, member 8 [Pediculus humanus corporis]